MIFLGTSIQKRTFVDESEYRQRYDNTRSKGMTTTSEKDLPESNMSENFGQLHHSRSYSRCCHANEVLPYTATSVLDYWVASVAMSTP